MLSRSAGSLIATTENCPRTGEASKARKKHRPIRPYPFIAIRKAILNPSPKPSGRHPGHP
jgi:hypothetical protein